MPWTCSQCGCEAGMFGCSNPDCGKEIRDLLREVQSKYILFNNVSWNFKDKKNLTFEIISKKSNDLLGIIKWYGAWRQYCLFPNEDMVFNDQCLNNIQDVLKILNAFNKERRKNVKLLKNSK